MSIKKILKISFVLWLFSIPFSFPWNPNFGQEVSYDTSFPHIVFYTSDIMGIFFLSSLITYLYLHRKSILALRDLASKYKRLLLLGSTFAILPVISSSWSGSYEVSLVLGSRILIYFLGVISILFFVQKKYFRNIFFKSLVLIGLFQGAIAFLQFITQKSLGLYFLGESKTGENVLGLARVWIGENHLLRSYGTLPHPNILGGFMLFLLAITYFVYIENKDLIRNKIFWIGVFAFELTGLILSFSRLAILAFIFLVIFYFGRELIKLKNENNKYIFKLIVAVCLLGIAAFVIMSRGSLSNQISFHNESVKLRYELAKGAINGFFRSPILGRGYGTGPIELLAFSDFQFYPWELQPVHNIFLLVLSELGIVGMSVFICFLVQACYCLKRNKGLDIFRGLFLSFIFIGFFDHYFLTLPQGIFIFFLTTFFCLAELQKRKKLPQAVKKDTSFLWSE